MRTLGLLLASAALALPADNLRIQVDTELPPLLTLYRDLHAHPELSRHEEHTSAILAAELRKAGYTVTDHIGKYADGGSGFGIVALMKNGPGPTVLVRTELDALPVEEKTGASFASTVRSKNAAGQDVGVMHACGHDLHMMSLLGTALALARSKDRWSGTVMLIAQPAEETVEGARAMLNDNFYARFGKPDYALALHNEPTLEAGKVGLVAGPVYASATTIEVRIRGIGGHGAHPESTKDPVVMAAQYVMAIQTIVSRQTLPLEPAVVTVGSIHGGSKNNIIPDEVVLELTVRAFNEDVRRNIVASLDRIARGIALAAGVPEDRAPIMKVFDNESVPATYNDPKLVERLRGAFTGALGKDNVVDLKPIMVSEDFGLFGLEGHQIPLVLFLLGTSSPEQLAESRRTGKPMPSLHSNMFLPDAEPALRTGITATTSAVLDLLKK
ncbi:MAG TPA: amidohydrolase [Bryobacteraceae bacterium]|jgi:hippurate hydrolase|nr:amidohydrolase [Bryobacteraceae bacterium]